jgi:large subunit ribosomal protein L24
MHVKKGDSVVVLAGKDKGKKGTIAKALPKQNKVIIDGLNQVKKHQKPQTRDGKGTTITISLPMDVSNVALASGTKAPKVKKVVKAKVTKVTKEKKS